MKTLAIKQPWAWLIVNGFKDIENRTWRTKYRGEFLVHASKQINPEMYYCFRGEGYNLPIRTKIELGGIVGKVVLTDVVTESTSEWFEGPIGFVLKDAQTLPFKPCKGQLNFYEVNYDEI